MNKTISINLAGTFFHIDEDAYQKLQRYLDAVRRSFADTEGSDEIVTDIEARIAELFYERVSNERQVISNNLVDEIISIMGQPEDYIVDEELFDDDDAKPAFSKKSKSKSSKSKTESKSETGNKTSTSAKKLFRDRENSYIAGVCSGLGHYLGIDAIWIRLLIVLLGLGSAGTFVFIYILFWVLVPEAVTTSEKLQMKGEPVNISNIEKKIKDGISSVTETVKNVDIQKHTDDLLKGVDKVADDISKSFDSASKSSTKGTVRKSSRNFFDTIGNIVATIFKVFGKFLGGIILFVAAVTLISLVVGLLSFDPISINLVPDMNLHDISIYSSKPEWLIKLLVLGAVGIPFFFLFYLGLKLIASNSRSISGGSKFTLFFLWIFSIITLGSFGLKEELRDFSEEFSMTKKETLTNLTANDTIYLSMNENDYYDDEFKRRFSSSRFTDENGDRVYISRGVRLVVRSTTEDVARIRVQKFVSGRDYEIAKDKAERIIYDYNVKGKTINLDSYFKVDKEGLTRNQEVRVTLYLPVGSTFYGDKSTYSFHRNESEYNDIFNNGQEDTYLKVRRGRLVPVDEDNETDIPADDSSITINEDGLKIKTENTDLKIDENGVKGTSNNVKVNIDENGVEITSEKESDN